MRIRYTPRAQSNLRAIYHYLDQRSPAAAQSVKNSIERRIASLADFPLMAPVTDESDIYELTIVRYPYKIYYEVVGDEVYVDPPYA
jgi:toxin ParE1/3/4